MRVFAGPNGSGKTTIFKQIAEKYDIGIYINADEIELLLRSRNRVELEQFGLTDLPETDFEDFQRDHGIQKKAKLAGFELNLSYSPTENCIVNLDKNPSYSYEASLIADFLRLKLIERGQKLTFETVMSHRGKLDILELAAKNGYKVYLYFICTQSADINVARVLQRVQQGGHAVLENKIRERYKSTLELLKPAVKSTYRSFVWDNSQLVPELILEVENGQIVTQISEMLPNWVEEHLLS